MDEIITLIKQDMPEGRQSLKDSFVNLEKVAEYCEDSYMRWVGRESAAFCSNFHASIRSYALKILLSGPITSEPLSKRRRTSPHNRWRRLLIRSTRSPPTTSNCSIFRPTIWGKWNHKWTTSHKRWTFTRKKSHVVKSAFWRLTKSHRVSIKSSHHRIPRSPSSMYENRSITVYSTRSVMVCIMANKWQPKDRLNNRRFSAMRQFRRRRRNHRHRPAWVHCAQVRRLSVAREQ